MKEISLTKGFVALVDDTDYDWLNKYKWFYTNGYAKGWVEGSKTYMHRLILGCIGKELSHHKDDNKLNNQRSNLARVTHGQNERHKSRKDYGNDNTYKGVYPKFNKWVARIWHNNESVHLGYFSTAEEAARAYDQKAIEFFGNDIRRNFS